MNGKMKRLLCYVMTLATVIGIFAMPASVIAAGKVVYVSPNGSDSGSGTISSPYRTIEKAKSSISGNAAGATVYIRGGDYYVGGEILFGANDSGSSSNPVRYVAYNGEKVNLYGGSRISASSITTASAEVSSRVLDATAKSKLLQIDLSGMYPGGIPKYYSYGNTADANKYAFQIYCGELPLTRSRWPNEGAVYPYAKTTTKAEQVNGTSSAGSAYKYYYNKLDGTSERVNQWSSKAAEDLFVHGFWAYEYNTEDCRVTELNRAANSMTIVGGINAGDWKTASTDCRLTSCRFYFFNLPEEIDRPGECYIDYDTSKVYFYPPEGFDANNVFVSNLMTSMMGFYGAHDIIIDGLNFKYMRKNAISIHDSRGADFPSSSSQSRSTHRGITIQNCTIAHSSGNAISACGSNINVLNCNIYDMGSGGIMMYGGIQISLTSGNSTIKNCSITNFTRNERTYEPAIEAASVGLLISHNKISGGIHQAIGSYNFTNDTVIEYNEISHCVTDAYDMGAVYYGRNMTVLGTVIRYNYFHDIGSYYESKIQHAVYIDDGAFGAEIYGNVFYKASARDYEPAAVKLHGSQTSNIYNNIFIDMPYGIEDAAWVSDSPGYQQQWVRVTYNEGYGHPAMLQAAQFDKGTWKQRYTGTLWGEPIWSYITTAKLTQYSYNAARGETINPAALVNSAVPYRTNKIYDNVFYKMSGGNVYDVWSPQCNHEETNSYVATSETIFTNYGTDFSLTASGLSTVKSSAKNFVNIPFSSIGPAADHYVPVAPEHVCEHTLGSAATCETSQVCVKCGVVFVEAYGHNNVGGSCTRCGMSIVNRAYHYDLYDDVDNSETGRNQDGTYGIGKLAYAQMVTRAQVAASAASKTLDASIIGAAKAHKVFLDSNSGNKGMSWITTTPNSTATINDGGTISGDTPYIAYKVSGAGQIKELTVKIHAGNLSEMRYAVYITPTLKYTNASTGQLDFSGARMIGTVSAVIGLTFYTEDEAETYTAEADDLAAIGSPSELYVVVAINNLKSTGSSDSSRLSGLDTTNCRLAGVQIRTKVAGTGGGTAHTHSMSYTAAKAATCSSAGNTAYYYCSGCGRYFTNAAGTTETTLAATVIAKTAHTYGATLSSNASGHWYACTVCGSAGTVNVHIPNVENATTSTAKYCVLCNYVIEQQIVQSHTHTMSYIAAKAATCTAAGNTAYYYCSGCGKYYSDAAGNIEITLASTVIAKTNHTYGTVYSSNANGHWVSCTACSAKGVVNVHIPNVESATTSTAKYCVLCSYVIEQQLPTIPTEPIVGDANNDGVKSMADVKYVINHLLFGTAFYPVHQNMDYDGDGKVNNADGARLLNSVLFGM